MTTIPAKLGEPLDPFEVRLLTLASNGHTNLEMVALVGAREDMVKYYLRKAYRKLGARDRTHAVRRGFEQGYLQPNGQAVA